MEAACQLFPEEIQFSSLQLTGDNQAAVRAYNEFCTRTSAVNKTLKQVFDLCVKYDVMVSAVWKPRELLKMEDLLSRQPYSSDWGIDKKLAQNICREFGVKIGLDLFASDTWHLVNSFVGHLYTPRCVAAQALALDWRLLLPEGSFAWIFPPVWHIDEVVQRIERFRTNCVLVVPEQMATNWWIQIARWSNGTEIQRFVIPRSTKVCRPSRRVPPNTANPGLLKLRAIKIIW
jgi:hypothetical protein